VIPSTNISPKLAARMHDDSIIIGESYIPKVQQQISEVFLLPKDTTATPESIEAIEEADIIVLGPGSLYTSIIPNLLPSGMREALIHSRGTKVYISNIMTQVGETIGYTATDHLKAINKHIGQNVFDYIVQNERNITSDISDYYRENGMTVVTSDKDQLDEMGISILTRDNLVSVDKDGAVRHNNDVIAEIIYDIALTEISTLQYRLNKDQS